jgi:dihydroorotate dehydrogenase electron transfer subunit
MPVDVHAEVLANIRLSDDYNVITLAAPEIAVATAPGQFVMVRTSDGVDPLLRRPFSVFEIVRDAAGRPSAFTLLNKRVGQGTSRLFHARPGDRVTCLGPLGRPFDPVSPPDEAWLVAGGVGLAPFATLAEALHRLGTPTTLFYGARRSTDLHCADLFEGLGARVVAATEDGSRGDAGFVTQPLERALGDLAGGTRVRVYACGPTPMMRGVAALAARFGHPCDVSLEQTMGCGMGGCYSCVVRVRQADGSAHFVRSCLAGPVFDARRIVWNALVH